VAAGDSIFSLVGDGTLSFVGSSQAKSAFSSAATSVFAPTIAAWREAQIAINGAAVTSAASAYVSVLPATLAALGSATTGLQANRYYTAALASAGAGQALVQGVGVFGADLSSQGTANTDQVGGTLLATTTGIAGTSTDDWQPSILWTASFETTAVSQLDAYGVQIGISSFGFDGLAFADWRKGQKGLNAMPPAKDITQRSLETRGVIRPYEIRWASRPFTGVPTQRLTEPRITNWNTK
jgi:hypothetical protein